MEQKTISLEFTSEAFEVVDGEVGIFPEDPTEDQVSRVNRGELQVLSVSFTGRIARNVPAYQAGPNTAIFSKLSVQDTQNRRFTATGLMSLTFPISQEDIERGSTHLSVPPFGWVTVTVMDSHGQPLEGKSVDVVNGGEVWSGKTDANGKLTFYLYVGHYCIKTEKEEREVTIRRNFEEIDLQFGLAVG